MQVSLENGVITVKIPVSAPRESSTGKTMIVATETAKNVAVFDGHPLSVGVNVYFKK